MLKDIKTTYAPINKKLGVLFLDFVFVAIGFVCAYFSLLHAVFSNATNYVSNQKYVNDIETSLNLNIGDDKTYQEYESIIKDFYFSYYPDEVKDYYNSLYEEDMSLMYIYNITVLSLPFDPIPGNHSNSVFTYRQNEDGTYNPDIEGVFLYEEDERSSYFYKNARDIYYGAYGNLKVLLMNFDEPYRTAINENSTYQSYCRAGAGVISVLILYIIIPLCNKKHLTISQLIFKVAQVDYKSGYFIKWYKLVLRPICYYLIPILLIALSSQFTFYILAFFYIFISALFIILRDDRRDIAEKILSMQTIDLNDSIVFESDEQEKKYEDSEEYKRVQDDEFLEKLSKIEPLTPLNKEKNK